MRNAARYAIGRAVTTIATLFGSIGLALTIILAAPVLELRVNPPVTEWEIINPRRTGDTLIWRAVIDKRRSCTASVTWLANWAGETSELQPNVPAREAVVIQPGQRRTIGPITAPLPRGWTWADDIKISAVVEYNCGTPWRLPPLQVRERQVLDL